MRHWFAFMRHWFAQTYSVTIIHGTVSITHVWRRGAESERCNFAAAKKMVEAEDFAKKFVANCKVTRCIV